MLVIAACAVPQRRAAVARGMQAISSWGDAMPTSTKKTAEKKPSSPTPDVLLKPKAKADIVDVPARKVIAREGAGGPEEPGFGLAVGALYAVAYTMKFARKKAGLEDNKVGVLEGEWSAEGASLVGRDPPPRDTWRWRVQIAVPGDTSTDELRDAVVAATGKKKGKVADNPELSREVQKVSLVDISPARFARILHKGSYATEVESFERIGELLDANGLAREPWHVEVYLSDPNRTAPEKLKTTLLAPIK
jgi:hypothetical protein